MKKNTSSYSLNVLISSATTASSGVAFFTLASFWSQAFGNENFFLPLFYGAFGLSIGIGNLTSFWRVSRQKLTSRRQSQASLFFAAWFTTLWAGGLVTFLKPAIALLGGSWILPILFLIPMGWGLGHGLTTACSASPKEKRHWVLFFPALTMFLCSMVSVLWLLPSIGHGKTALVVALTALGMQSFGFPGRLYWTGTLTMAGINILFWAYPVMHTINQQAALSLFSIKPEGSRKILFQKQANLYFPNLAGILLRYRKMRISLDRHRRIDRQCLRLRYFRLWGLGLLLNTPSRTRYLGRYRFS